MNGKGKRVWAYLSQIAMNVTAMCATGLKATLASRHWSHGPRAKALYLVALMAIASALAAVFVTGQVGSAAEANGKPASKVTSDLVALHDEYQAHLQGASGGEFKASNASLPVSLSLVTIDAVAAEDTSALRSELEALGIQSAASFGALVSGLLPIGAIPQMAALDSLKFARPAYAMTNVGTVTSQGDVAMRSDIARSTFGVDGTGVTVGTLSDSYNCLSGAAGDVASGDLPGGSSCWMTRPAPARMKAGP